MESNPYKIIGFIGYMPIYIGYSLFIWGIFCIWLSRKIYTSDIDWKHWSRPIVIVLTVLMTLCYAYMFGDDEQINESQYLEKV